MKNVVNTQTFKYAAAILAGIAIGSLLYPTKKIEEEINNKHQKEINTIKQSHDVEKKSLSDKLVSSANEFNKYKKETELKISKQTQEITQLKKKQKTSYFKLIKPDGTIEIRRFAETEVDESTKVIENIQQEFKIKLDIIEQKWEKIHRERVEILVKDFELKESRYLKTINDLQISRSTTINAKRFSVDAGLLSTTDYYGHATMDFWGPMVIGVHGQLGRMNALGAGIGIRF